MRSKKIMDSKTIRMKGQENNFMERAPGRRSHERGQTLAEEGPAETTMEKTVARAPVKWCQKKMTTRSNCACGSQEQTAVLKGRPGSLTRRSGPSLVDLGPSSVDLVLHR